MTKPAPDYPGIHAWAKARAAEEAAVKLNRTVYADKDGIIAQLREERQQASANAALTGTPHYRRQYWAGKAEGLEFAIKLLQDWAGEEEPEPDTSVVTCVCGYGPTTETDLDEHVLASMHLPGDHIARR